MLKKNLIEYDPAKNLIKVKQEAQTPKWLTKKQSFAFQREIERRIQSAKTPAARSMAARDWAICSLMLFAGLREGEVVGLNWEDVALKDRSGKINIRMAKGRKFRTIPLEAEARNALKNWSEIVPLHSGLLFNIQSSEIQKRVTVIGKSCGLNIHPHQLRHTFAKRLVDAGVPIHLVSKLMGHASIVTTSIYTTPGDEDLQAAIDSI